MSDLISRQVAIDAINEVYCHIEMIKKRPVNKTEQAIYLDMIGAVKSVPSAEPTHREKALLLLLDWAIECGFGYDNIPEEYAIYEKDVENMGYMEGLIYIAEREVEHNERHN